MLLSYHYEWNGETFSLQTFLIMLRRLVVGGEESNNVLITVDSHDRLLARDIINLFLSVPDLKTPTVLVKTGPAAVCSDLPRLASELDLTDFQGWSSGGPGVGVQQFPEVVLSSVEPASQNVVIDNLTDLLVFYSHSSVTQLVRRLRQSSVKKNKLFFVLHRDCLAPEILEDIVKFVTTTITVSDINGEKLCKIQQTKPGGKLVTSTEVIRVDSERNIKTEKYQEVKARVAEEEEDPVIESLTTFSLSTRQREKEVKDGLVLPFYKDNQTAGQTQVKLGGGTKIYYEPDSGDDWDDEDPDDDLDF